MCIILTKVDIQVTKERDVIMSTLRSLERGVIRNKIYQKEHSVKSFPDIWERLHYTNKGLVKPRKPVRENLSKQELMLKTHFLRKLKKIEDEQESADKVND